MKTTLWMSGIFAVTVMAGTTVYTIVSSDRSAPLQVESPEAPATAFQNTAVTAELERQTHWQQRVDQLAARLVRDYGETIAEPATQAYLFVEREKLAEAYPADGQALFAAALAVAFPDLSASILELMAGMDRYHQWLTDNELSLREMALVQRRAAIWQQREAIFGAKASAIWGEEETAVSRNAEAVRDELARLDQAHELSPEEVAHQLSTTVDNLYGLEAAGQLVTPQALGQTLFSLESVQADLAALPEEQRQQRMASLRRQMGYTEDEVRRLDQLDRQRNQSWQEGEAYMSERQALTRQYQGEPLEQALDELRREHFGATAPTIAREEQQGFFRFQRERRYGLN